MRVLFRSLQLNTRLTCESSGTYCAAPPRTTGYSPMLTLYGMRGSGNCYKPALLMHQLGIGFRWEEVDIVNGASRTDAFLAMNPNGKVPLLQVDDGRMLADSNAILRSEEHTSELQSLMRHS